uniref:uncharacterized protein LOC122589631 n=1 Tax=Erigeron canadensis TaxID=72917 RepID=UPI001CB91634|nr:uncharacterized protein LOC122589631 [Erigeron canadensis]
MAIAASSDSKASVSTVNKMITDDNETEIAVETKSEKPAKKKRNNNPGVRVIRGQIYDSQNGITCHQCRQKTYTAYVACKNLEKTKPCPIKYCRKCLLNRYGEKAEDVELLDQWDCPKCKGVCNCSMCMKKRGQQPTGQLAKMAKAGGFSSVLDLIDAKGVQNVSNYKRAKGTTASPRKLDAAGEEIMITSPKKLGKENLFDGKTDSNADSQLSVPPHAENKPRKKKRKGAEVMQNGTGVSDHALNEKNQKKVKSKSSKEFVGETTKRKPENEAEGNTIVHDQKAAQLLEKPQKIKQKRVKVMQDTIGVGDHASNEKKQKKTNSKESKEICGEIVSSGTSLKDNRAQQPQNEPGEKTTTCDHTATQHLNGNQHSKVKQNAISSFEAVIPLPTGSELVTIAGVDLPKEDAGNALQLLEFCSTFGKILDVKKGQAEAVLRDLINGRSTRRGKFTSVIQFHIQLLSVIQEESESESESESSSSDLTLGNDSWWKALKSCISKSQLKHMDCIETEAGEYDSLDASMKLRLLICLCDEVLGTEKLRTWMDDQNVKFVEKKKEAKDKLCAAKDKEKSLKQKMLDDVAKAVIANEGVPLTTMEYDAIVSKIKNKAAEAHAEMLECKTMVPIDKERPDSVRTEPIFRDNKGHLYWRLKGCSDKAGILLQDIGTGDHAVEVVDNWFEFDDEQTGLIESHINLLRSRFRKCYKN